MSGNHKKSNAHMIRVWSNRLNHNIPGQEDLTISQVLRNLTSGPAWSKKNAKLNRERARCVEHDLRWRIKRRKR